MTFVQKDGDYEKRTGLHALVGEVGEMVGLFLDDDSKVIYIVPC